MSRSNSEQLPLPQMFEENGGQFHKDVRFAAKGQHGSFYIHSDKIRTIMINRNTKLKPVEPGQEYTLSGVAIDMSFVDANTGIIPQGMEESDAKYHYLRGNDPAQWNTNLSAYRNLRYNGLWEGIDLELTGGSQGLKMCWYLDAPARISALRLRLEGGNELALNEDGSLTLKHAFGELVDPAPIAWQIVDGQKITVDCAFRIDEENEYGFILSGSYNESLPLVIDPLIPYTTYLGGNSSVVIRDITVDNQGHAYVAGFTTSTDFPVTPGAFQTTMSGQTGFVTKLSEDGSSLVYSTFLGGNSSDAALGITVDASGFAYITGSTRSADFPITPGAFQTSLNGITNAFIAKLSEDGSSLVYSTFLGGSGDDSGLGIAIDNAGFAYITGQTSSLDFPVTPGAFQTTRQGIACSFVTKLSTDGGGLIYSTYIGGTTGNDSAYRIALDSGTFAYIVGTTSSTDFPVTPGAFQTTLHGGVDAFVTKFSIDGSSLVYSTYLGGSTFQNGFDIAVDSGGHACVVGETTSTDFPVTPGAFQTTMPGGSSAYITKFSSDGSSLTASTFLGGSEDNGGSGIAVNPGGFIYVTGYTTSEDFPTTPEIIPSSFQGDLDAIVSILSPDLSRLMVSYYLGGSEFDAGNSIALGPKGGFFSAGITFSSDFPVTPGAFQTIFSGFQDGYISSNYFTLIRISSASLSIVRIG